MWLQRRVQHNWHRLRAKCSAQSHHRLSSLSVYDTESQQPTAVAAPPGSALLWYSCGPTVYDTAHVGHARAYVCQDIIRRIIEQVMQQPLLYVMGMTDVDDKIIQRAAAEGRPWRRHAAVFESRFMQDMQALGVRPPHHIVRVSEHIATIVQHIQDIEAAGVTYRTPSGLYFDVGAFPGTYGKLRANSAHAEQESTTNTTVGASDKRSPADFALWKAAKAGEPSWESPWGAGRPGWHIECSAMAAKVLGKKLHLHSGGVDLAFPHHTNEIAQTEASLLPAGGCCGAGGASAQALSGFKWVDAWMHCGHVHIQGRKMSKSLKNFISVQDMLQELGDNAAVVFRMWCLQRHYRSSVTWDTPSVQQAAAALHWWATWSTRTRAAEQAAWAAQVHSGRMDDDSAPSALPWGAAEAELHSTLTRGLAAARAALLGNDFDTPGALAELKKCAVATDTYVHSADTPNSLAVLQARQGVQGLLRALGVPLPHHSDALLGADANGRQHEAKETDAARFDSVNASRVHLRELALAALSGGSGGEEAALAKAVLQACDVMRDHVLPSMSMGSAVSDDAAAVAAAQRRWQELSRQPKREPVSEAHVEKPPKLAEWQQSPHWIDLSVHPDDVFRVDSQLYAPFDGQVPSHMADGSSISKNKLKKMRKAADRYTGKYQAHGGKDIAP